MKRPVGVTVLAVIAMIYGVFSLLLAFLAVVGLALQGSAVASRAIKVDPGTLAYAAVSDAIIGIVFLVFGIGAFRLKGWAWTVGVAALLLEVVRDIIAIARSGLGVFSVVSGVIALLLLVYLFTPNVRSAFGKAAQPAPL